MSLDYIDVAGNEHEEQDFSLTTGIRAIAMDDYLPTETEAVRETASNTLQPDGVDERQEMTCIVDNDPKPIEDSIPTETEAVRETSSNKLQPDEVDEKQQMMLYVEPKPSFHGEKGPITPQESVETRDAVIHSILQNEETVTVPPSEEKTSHEDKEKQRRYRKGASSYADKAKQLRQKMEERKLQRASVIDRCN
jgi:hypothetical protein